MVHLGALPGAPGFDGDLASLISAAVADATTLEAAGFEAVMVENFGDVPFYADDVPKVTVAAMTAAVGSVRDAVSLPIGVNVLRNDAVAALAVAAATGATMVRVNVLSGTMYTDQGPIVGKAAKIARLRTSIAPDVSILADVFVKHATAPAGLTLQQATEDTIERAGADALVVSGTGTGREPELETVRTVAAAADDTPVLVGSGATVASLADYLAIVHGAIVGTSVKAGGRTTEPVDPGRSREIVEAYRRATG